MKHFDISYIVTRLNEIDAWISENGFSNRGHGLSMKDKAREIESAMNILANAGITLMEAEFTYESFYIEKMLEKHPEIRTKTGARIQDLINRFENGWLYQKGEIHDLYRCCQLYENKK